MSWLPTVEAGVGLYELGFLVRGEGTKVDVHCIPTLGCGAASLVVSSTLLISELPSNLEVLFKGLPFGVISLGGVVKLRGLPLSVLFLGGLGPLLKVPGDCWVIIMAIDDGLDELSQTVSHSSFFLLTSHCGPTFPRLLYMESTGYISVSAMFFLLPLHSITFQLFLLPSEYIYKDYP